MCGLFGIISGTKAIDLGKLSFLAKHAQQRGKDSSGFVVYCADGYEIYRSNNEISSFLKEVKVSATSFLMGHSRLVTNGLSDNQPIFRDDVCVIHNGIIVNDQDLWGRVGKTPFQKIDTEIIAAIVSAYLKEGGSVEGVCSRVLELCQGTVACAVALPKYGKLCLFSNNGSLYYGRSEEAYYFASERFPLEKIKCDDIFQVRGEGVVIDIPISENQISVYESEERTNNLVPSLGVHLFEECMLEYIQPEIHRCARCILPETMPYITFDDSGICNYCHSYKPRNRPRPLEELVQLLEIYRREHGDECIVPFSGGRDSCYGLHLIAKELEMKPITYTYDWGMVTDLGRRNISRMSAALGVENIIVADDIGKKRQNIAVNLKAWLRSPHLGMVSILTAGDKHFFRHVETVKRQTGISLNLWGVNPLEVTHFKAGFLGVPPDFAETRVYSSGAFKQLRYQWLRLKAMSGSLGYFNRSLWDTYSGEYYRSFSKKTDYYHIFDYWRWDEDEINQTLSSQYDWECAPDTNTTWRIGDGTAAFYNYIYYTVAGFTEHDTFRSNQIREGDISREAALDLVKDENRPRYPNIKWYLDAIGMDFEEVIKVINAIPKLFRH